MSGNTGGQGIFGRDGLFGPDGLGGWLLPLGAAIVLVPVFLIFAILDDFNLMHGDHWASVSTRGQPGFRPNLEIVLLSKIAINIGFLASWVLVVMLFFARKHWFQSTFINLCVLHLAWAVGALFLDRIAGSSAQLVSQGALIYLCFTGGFALIWVPFVKRSARVNAVFERDPLARIRASYRGIHRKHKKI
ncbi:MAG: DUF2569 family protein [Cohaesibacteraceae bacterium]|nr:DUF2569 family protein [Cohaesibacteraceae bacterium]MBL4876814.1 DUF2569 family protein [Cohaesibacteraceae bacterium]